MVSYEQPLIRRRAVNDLLKDARRETILVVALELFCKNSFESITMGTISVGAGLAKGTLYLYFHSREEIFLALLARELHAWLAAVGQATKEWSSLNDGLDWIADSLTGRGELLRLSSLFHSALEQHVPIETVRAFKLTYDAGLCEIAPDLAVALGLKDEHAARRFLRWIQVCTIGLYQIASPTPVVQASILGEARLAHMVIDFQSELRDMLAALLTGTFKQEI